MRADRGNCGWGCGTCQAFSLLCGKRPVILWCTFAVVVGVSVLVSCPTMIAEHAVNLFGTFTEPVSTVGSISSGLLLAVVGLIVPGVDDAGHPASITPGFAWFSVTIGCFLCVASPASSHVKVRSSQFDWPREDELKDCVTALFYGALVGYARKEAT